MIGKERCRGGGFRSSKLAVIWCSPLKGTLSQPLWEENPARVHDPPIFLLGIFLWFLFCSLCLSGIYLPEVMSATNLSPTRQIGCDMTGFILFHTPQPLWRLHLGHVVLVPSCGSLENSHIHYSSAEAVYKVSSINCLLLGVHVVICSRTYGVTT